MEMKRPKVVLSLVAIVPVVMEKSIRGHDDDSNDRRFQVSKKLTVTLSLCRSVQFSI